MHEALQSSSRSKNKLLGLPAQEINPSLIMRSGCLSLLGVWLVVLCERVRGGADVAPENLWNYRDVAGDEIKFLGDPSPGLAQRSCKHYYGPVPTKSGKEWANRTCSAPFDQVCIMIKGQAEVEAYKFEMSYVRGCFYRCPCPDSQPWVEWYMGRPGDPHRIMRRWEKRCILQTPPRGYAIGSDALPFPKVMALPFPSQVGGS